MVLGEFSQDVCGEFKTVSDDLSSLPGCFIDNPFAQGRQGTKESPTVTN